MGGLVAGWTNQTGARVQEQRRLMQQGQAAQWIPGRSPTAQLLPKYLNDSPECLDDQLTSVHGNVWRL
jgi:hypothetical protein